MILLLGIFIGLVIAIPVYSIVLWIVLYKHDCGMFG